MLTSQGDRLIYQYDAEKLWIEPWGTSALRIRATKAAEMPSEEWALSHSKATTGAEIEIDSTKGTINNGDIKAEVTAKGKLSIFNAKTGRLLLEEYHRTRSDVTEEKCSALEVEAREFKPILGGDYHLTMRFESLDAREKIYGMGQYQQPYIDLKGADLELAHRNSQCSVPFATSSLGYGILWNNPSIGRAVFGKNTTSFEAYSTNKLDYWVVAGNKPSDLVEAYGKATGTVPMMPEYGLGFWQCKLRYQNQEELLNVAREYKKRNLPLDLIVIDFFHWPRQGDWRFDETYWPDVDAMVKELQDMKVKLMISIWPSVDRRSENYDEMLEKGYLVRTDRGIRICFDFEGNTVHVDPTNPAARQFLWNKVKRNYFDKGIDVFWLDEAEPEYSIYDFDNFRYHLGSNLAIGNIYPVEYARAFYDGQTAAGQKSVVNLLRCAWAGSQKLGALVWSGDIASSWSSFRNQLAAGLNMGMAGLPWWTTDIGGFHGGDPDDPAFRELLVRWFQWGAFCPVFRLHGDREPRQPQQGMTGGATCCSGAQNEVWSFGDEAYEILKAYMAIRETMRDYIRSLMKEAHEKGSPVMRLMSYEFPEDKQAWEVEDQYMFGHKYLVAPVLQPGVTSRKVYLPSGASWKSWDGTATYPGASFVDIACPLSSMPVLVRE